MIGSWYSKWMGLLTGSVSRQVLKYEAEAELPGQVLVQEKRLVLVAG
jgi:hypothetical protein